MSEKVLIMMASYNGAQFIGEQIESIIAQTYSNWELVIQDDGSTDRTIDIIKEYCAKESRIRFYTNDSEYHGPFYNFWSLFNKCKLQGVFAYYMFADQDDIWNPDKLVTMINFISKKELPFLMFADMGLCDYNGNVTDKSLNVHFKMGSRDRYNVFFSHKVFGCNMICNKALFELVPVIDISDERVKTLSHDNFFTKYAVTFGGIEYIDKQTMLYRRHEKSVTGEMYYKRSKLYVLRRMFKFDDLAKSHARIYNQSLFAIESILNEPTINKEQKDYIYEIDKAIKEGGFWSLRFLIRNKVNCGRFTENISRCVVLFLGIHKKYLIV